MELNFFVAVASAPLLLPARLYWSTGANIVCFGQCVHNGSRFFAAFLECMGDDDEIYFSGSFIEGSNIRQLEAQIVRADVTVDAAHVSLAVGAIAGVASESDVLVVPSAHLQIE